MVRDEAGRDAGSIDALGRRLTKEFDDLGNLAALRLPDGSRHKVCTHRASEHSRIPVNTPVTVTVRDSVFDRSIE